MATESELIINNKQIGENMFTKYQHLEKHGNVEVKGIENGTCYIFPKLDGTNASIWIENGEIKAGSRNRELTLENDNAGFYAWVLKQDNIKEFLSKNPNLILYGEWLVPHTLKTYINEAWNNFYVFDIYATNTKKYLDYKSLSFLCELYHVDFVPCIGKVVNGNYEHFASFLDKTTYLIQGGKGIGEGIVIKNYDFVNDFGNTVWAKIVCNEFKSKHVKTMGAPILTGEIAIEERIATKYITETLCQKEYAKININNDWTSKNIPQLLNTIYYCLINEEIWNILKEHKNPTIDFSKLKYYVTIEIKKHLSFLF